MSIETKIRGNLALAWQYHSEGAPAFLCSPEVGELMRKIVDYRREGLRDYGLRQAVEGYAKRAEYAAFYIDKEPDEVPAFAEWCY